MSNYPDDVTQATFDRYHSHQDDPYEADTDETPQDYGERHPAGCVCCDCSGAELTAEND